jgi:RNA-directed DNA polymerase
MERYTKLPKQEKTKRRKQGLANYIYVRYADDFVVICNGSKIQAEVLREELYSFLKTTLRLELDCGAKPVSFLMVSCPAVCP